MGKIGDTLGILGEAASIMTSPVRQIQKAVEFIPGAWQSATEGVKGIGIFMNSVRDGSLAAKMEFENMKNSLLNMVIKLAKQLLEGVKEEQLTTGEAIQNKAAASKNAASAPDAQSMANPAAAASGKQMTKQIQFGMDELLKKTAGPVANAEKTIADAAKTVPGSQEKTPTR